MSIERAEWPNFGRTEGSDVDKCVTDVLSQLNLSSPNKEKQIIWLTRGDPTTYPNLIKPDNINKILIDIISSNKYNGYENTCGSNSAREALAKYYSLKNMELKMEDVFVTAGCSDALNIALSSFLNLKSDDTILIPRPCYCQYISICHRYNFKYKHYDLLPKKNWEIDINNIKHILENDSNIKLILINNPSNPCGSIFPQDNLSSLLKIAHQYKIPILSDEIYSTYALNSHRFASLPSLLNGHIRVPIVVINGISKQFLMPGWRCGWILIYDNTSNQSLNNVRSSINSLTNITRGCNSVIQNALPSILDYYRKNSQFTQINNSILTKQSNAFLQYIEQNVPQLTPIAPQGAFFVFIKINLHLLSNHIKNDVDFANLLYSEQSLAVVPSAIFGIPNYFRIVICPSLDILMQSAKRLHLFCQKHSIQNQPPSKL